MSLPTAQEKQRGALEEITRAMNLLLNEIVGITDGGVKPETFERARRAYDAATTALRGDMAEWARKLSARNPNAPGGAREAGCVQRECCNGECGWKGATDRMLGSVGPLCPECGEVTEPTNGVLGTYKDVTEVKHG